VVDLQFADVRLAALYDVFHPSVQRDDFAFYIPFIMSSESVLDVGCGTGALLKQARDSGHKGRLCGLDPADGMLEQARSRSDIEWVAGDLGSTRWIEEFDLVVMAGHAFQVLVEDEIVRTSLAAVRRSLKDDGRFAFETRNPTARGWESWTLENAREVVDGSGSVIRMAHEVELPVSGDTVSFVTTFTSPEWDAPVESRSTLRFLNADALDTLLVDAGFTIEEQFGDWDCRPLAETSTEIITLARPTRGRVDSRVAL
jgi:SAM-dependent methyltransferase